MSLVVTPTPSLPSVPASTLLAWHLRVLRSWDIPCDAPEALANGQVEWTNPAPRIDLALMTKMPVERALLLAQAWGGVVFGAFANCPLCRGVPGRDPEMKSAIFVLEHPTGEQRKWHLQNGNYEVMASEDDLWFGTGFCIDNAGFLHSGRAPEFGMTEVDASFICLEGADDDGWAATQIDHWELWSV
jgi:hypothetical protein